VCASCATEDEKTFLRSLYDIDESILTSRDRRRALIPRVGPLSPLMMLGAFLMLISLLSFAYPSWSVILTISFFIGSIIFIYSWVMHQPVKVEALSDFEDMGVRIQRLRAKKEELIEILDDENFKLGDKERQILNKNVFV